MSASQCERVGRHVGQALPRRRPQTRTNASAMPAHVHAAPPARSSRLPVVLYSGIFFGGVSVSFWHANEHIVPQRLICYLKCFKADRGLRPAGISIPQLISRNYCVAPHDPLREDQEHNTTVQARRCSTACQAWLP